MIKYLQDIPINNWPIINFLLIIGRTLSLQCQYFSLKNNKKERGYICNITLECHSVLNLMTLESRNSYFYFENKFPFLIYKEEINLSNGIKIPFINRKKEKY